MSNTQFRVSSGLLLEVYPGNGERERSLVRIYSQATGPDNETVGAVVVRPEEIDLLIAALLKVGDRLEVGTKHSQYPLEDRGILKAQGLMPPPAHTRHRG